jgi:hypothetical protein
MTEYYNPPSASVCFIDLATFSEVEGFLYGGPMASTWFVAGIIKANWFSFVSVPLRSCGAAPIFGSRRSSFNLTRQADYALNATLRAKFPAIGFNSSFEDPGPTLRWVDNLMHNLIQHVQLEFNDLTVEEFDSWWFDVNFEFRCPGSKRVIYENMIGMTGGFISPVGPGDFVGGTTLVAPIPLFFGEDSGFSLPVAALPFNEVKITFDFRDWKQLVIIDPGSLAGPDITSVVTYINGVADNNTLPALSNVECWAHYAVVHQDERAKMGEAPRDLAIHQVQTIQPSPFKDITSRSTFDIRQAHSIISFFYFAQNVSLQTTYSGKYGSEQSNYTTLSSVLSAVPAYNPVDPLSFATLSYENQSRMSDSSLYYSLEVPWYFSDAGPENTGYHMGSYALKAWSACHPAGSTDYSKLANVSISYLSSPSAKLAAAGQYGDASNILWPTGSQTAWKQQFNHIFMSYNWNIGRVSHGSFGFPAL